MSLQQPPKWMLQLLRFYCKPERLEYIEGDLHELFEVRLDSLGYRRARNRFLWDVLRFFRRRNIKGLEDIKGLMSVAMFRNYVKISVRSLWRSKYFSIINIIGLAVGIACCLAIMMFVNDELSYDKSFKAADRIYRITLNERGGNTPSQLVKMMLQDFPEVESGTRVYGPFENTLEINGQLFKQQGGFVGDSTFFEVFEVDVLAGDAKNALNSPNSVVITRDLALKYFRQQNPLGQTIKSNGENYKITAVIENTPENSHMQYTMIRDIPRAEWSVAGDWTANNFKSYIRLKPGVHPDQVGDKFQDFVIKYVGPGILEYTGHASFEDYLAEGNKFNYHLVPITDIHLKYPWLSLGGTPGSENNVYIFSLVAFFILIVACINFINLSTSRSAIRAKEVGVRKVLGSLKKQLIGQFLVESMIITVVAMILSMVLVLIALPAFNETSGKSFSMFQVFSPFNLLMLLLVSVVTGLLAGAYPAFVISSTQPIRALKGLSGKTAKGGFLKKGLVTFQFAISMALIAFTLIIYFQLEFMTKSELGLQADQTMVIKRVTTLNNSFESFKNEINSLPDVKVAALASSYPSGGMSDWGYRTVEEVPLKLSPYNIFVDHSFLESLGLKLVNGRFFEQSRALDTTCVVINEAFAKVLNWENPVGQYVDRGESKKFKIIGVVKDFHSKSMRSSIRPMIMRYGPNVNSDGYQFGAPVLLVNVKGNYSQVVEKIGDLWESKNNEEPYDYLFLDESFNSLYEAERKFGRLFLMFSVLAIFIGAIGLLALAAYTFQKRLKEIAVRKVLGATEIQISRLLLTDFTKFIALAAVIAIPFAYYFAESWLEDFAFRIDLNVFYFMIPVVFVLIISWLTIGYQSYKTAKANPATVLKDE